MTPTTSPSPEPPSSVTCLPGSGYGAISWIVFFCGLGFLLLFPFLTWFGKLANSRPLHPSATSPYLIESPMVAVLWTWAISAAIRQKRAVIVADSTGVRWRIYKGFHEIHWDEVTALTINPQGREHKDFVIESKADRLSVQDYAWQNIPALLAFVSLHAASTARREWPPPGK